MRKFKIGMVAAALLIASPVYTQSSNDGISKFMSSVPDGSRTVMGLYKQNVYDASEKKIGQITDILVGADGSITGFVISAGGFVGTKSHDVLVPVFRVKVARTNSRDFLMLDATKDELKAAPAFKYDRNEMTWMPDDGKR